MSKKARSNQRRNESLSRDRIIEVAIEILDSRGESGLTFRALSEQLATGPGAIYWHIANKSELLTAACDAIVAPTMESPLVGSTPEEILRAIALGLFDAIDAHPWIGSALTDSPSQLPIVRILEGIGQQVRALGVPDDKQWGAASTLLHYILGVSAQNAANTQIAQTRGLDRDNFLDTVSTVWSRLDAERYPFTRSIAGLFRTHDDRKDYVAGINIILGGIQKI